nr:MAG TPA: hypothetical protein [Caudoviricetes sp.]
MQKSRLWFRHIKNGRRKYSIQRKCYYSSLRFCQIEG